MNDSAETPAADDQLFDLEPIDAARLLADREPAQIQAALAGLPSQQALEIAGYLPGATSSIEETAAVATVEGSIDALDLIQPTAFDADQTAADAVAFLARHDAARRISAVYVIDHGRLVGVLDVGEIMLARPGEPLSRIMDAEPTALTRDMPVKDAVRTALSHRHAQYPVVDDQGGLVGVLPTGTLFEYVGMTLSNQLGSQVGLSREEQVSTGLLPAFKLRHPWLQINLITAFAAAFVVALFGDTITRIVALAAFLPVLAGQSGNTGCQALAITLRGLTLGQLNDYPIGRLLRKEMALGALNGLFVGVIAGLAMWLYAGFTGEPNPLMLGVVIVVAMVLACVGSGMFGVLVPVTLKRFGADPAMASSIFLTTFTDILGMGLMLGLASLLLL